MALAQRLNELACANSEGLLNDDEYRLLRQNLFERYSGAAVIPGEAPVVRLTKPTYDASSSSPQRIPTEETCFESTNQRSLPTRSRSSLMASGVTSFLRRATGRKTPISPTSHEAPNNALPPSQYPQKRGVITRILQKKGIDLTPVRTNTTVGVNASVSNSSRASSKAPDGSLLQHPYSPTRSVRPPAIPTSPSKINLSSPVNDLFDDGNLETSKDIRRAIAAIENETNRLLNAFDTLEMTTSFRAHKQTARRLPSATPAHANVLIEGREWRDHSFRPPPSPLTLDKKSQRRHVLPAIDTSDGSSIRSGSSIRTTLSQSKSISSLPKHPGSPLSPRFPPPSPSLHHKNSISSVSSQQAVSMKRLGVSSTSISKSTGHLPLGMVSESEAMQSTDTVGGGSGEDADPFTEVADIRRRREEVKMRCEARLEFLRARLKGAELREKLLRK